MSSRRPSSAAAHSRHLHNPLTIRDGPPSGVYPSPATGADNYRTRHYSTSQRRQWIYDDAAVDVAGLRRHSQAPASSRPILANRGGDHDHRASLISFDGNSTSTKESRREKYHQAIHPRARKSGPHLKAPSLQELEIP
jgi:hypothetical protein